MLPTIALEIVGLILKPVKIIWETEGCKDEYSPIYHRAVIGGVTLLVVEIQTIGHSPQVCRWSSIEWSIEINKVKIISRRKSHTDFRTNNDQYYTVKEAQSAAIEWFNEMLADKQKLEI